MLRFAKISMTVKKHVLKVIMLLLVFCLLTANVLSVLHWSALERTEREMLEFALGQSFESELEQIRNSLTDYVEGEPFSDAASLGMLYEQLRAFEQKNRFFISWFSVEDVNTGVTLSVEFKNYDSAVLSMRKSINAIQGWLVNTLERKEESLPETKDFAMYLSEQFQSLYVLATEDDWNDCGDAEELAHCYCRFVMASENVFSDIYSKLNPVPAVP